MKPKGYRMSEKKEPKELKEQKEPKESKENKSAVPVKSELLQYKGKPLVRKDNVICFGDAKADDYILMLQIRDEKNIFIAIQSTDQNSTEGIVKYGQKDSLYEAFEIGEIWLESFLKQ